MITYDNLWKTMKMKNMSLHHLIKYREISQGQVERLKKNRLVSSSTIHWLCQVLDCRIEDILEYRDDSGESSGTNKQ
ncbi:MAG: helix-turn-helix transcriptional regulator [Lacrimispora sp.]